MQLSLICVCPVLPQMHLAVLPGLPVATDTKCVRHVKLDDVVCIAVMKAGVCFAACTCHMCCLVRRPIRAPCPLALLLPPSTANTLLTCGCCCQSTRCRPSGCRRTPRAAACQLQRSGSWSATRSSCCSHCCHPSGRCTRACSQPPSRRPHPTRSAVHCRHAPPAVTCIAGSAVAGCSLLIVEVHCISSLGHVR